MRVVALPHWVVRRGWHVGLEPAGGLVAILDEINGGGLRFINPALYRLANNPAAYASDFFDVTTGNNQADPTVPGFPATIGWDPVTGLGTPNAARLPPALVTAVHS